MYLVGHNRPKFFSKKEGTAMGTVYDAPWTTLTKYNHNRLPSNLINEWAEDQIELSMQYNAGMIPGTSEMKESSAIKKDTLTRLSERFSRPGCIIDYDNGMALFDLHLEDPGMLKNFIFFDAINSDDMLLFFYRIWNGDMARSLEAVYGEGYDLYGNYRECPKDESWYRMICYESMTINERQKALYEASAIVNNDSKLITYFGNGIPHLHHFDGRACRDRVISFYDNGFMPTKEETIRFNRDYDLLKFYQINCLQAANELWGFHETQNLIVMSGLSMYLYDAHPHAETQVSEKMLLAFKNANILLRRDGFFMFDFLLPTVCMKRLAITQCWPQATKMKIFNTCGDAINEAKLLVNAYNESISSASEKPFILKNIKVNTAEPWGPTSVYFTLRKVS